MPKRVGDRPMRSRMRRGRPATSGCSRPREGLVRGKHERCCAERRDKRPIYSIRHGGHQFVGCWAPLQGRLGRAFGGHKRIINYWLRFKINGGGPSSRLAAEMTKDFRLIDGDHDGSSHLPNRLREMPLPVHVLDQDDFTDPYDARFTVTGRNLVRRIQVDHVLTPRCGMPVEEPISRRRPEVDAGGG